MTAEAPDDESFELAYAAWRQFFALCLDRPPPTQPEIDARLMRYRRVHEAGSLAEFGGALVLAAGIAQALTATMRAVGVMASGVEILVSLLTGLLLVVLANRAFQHVRAALEYRALAQRIDTEVVEIERLRALLADVQDPDVRAYLRDALDQGRLPRRAEVAVALDRGRDARAPDDASREAFMRAVRGRRGVRSHEIAIAAACLVAVLASSTPRIDGATLLPALYMLAAVALAGLPANVIQLAVDPWQLAGGGSYCRHLRFALLADLAPPLAVFVAVVASAVALGAGT